MGKSYAEENLTDDKIIFNGSVLNGELRFTINSQDSKFDMSFIEALCKEFKISVNELAEYCSSSLNDDKTISDVYDDELDESEVDFLNNLFM